MSLDAEGISGVLEEIARILELNGENPFKIRAYHNGARFLESLTDDLDELIASGRLAEQPGIGEALADKIATLRRDGRLEFHEKLRLSLPPGLLEILTIPGVGPKKTRVLWTELGVTDIAALQAACTEGRVAALKGFGEKTQAKILDGIRNREAYGKRHLWAAVEPLVQVLLEGLRKLPQVKLAEAAGSFRRNRETVGDLDVIVGSDEPGPIMDWFVGRPGITEVTARGETKSSVRVEGGLQVDLRVVPPGQFFFALHHFTGSKDHNVAMRQRALSRGLSMSEWGLAPRDPEAVAPPAGDEPAVFAALGLPWIPPELREGHGEIEAAEGGNLPRLVTLADLRGAFHNHTTESDGKSTLEQMAAAADALGWEYLAITDHSQTSVYAGGLEIPRLERQIAAIAELNASGRFRTRILSGSEVDILRDGSLDYPDELLARLDVVVASVHAAFTIPEEEQTARIVRALEHPLVHILGHATGRLLLQREPYKVNLSKVIDAAAANGKSIELNAYPRRLDMDWTHWRRAAEKGVVCSINPDAHLADHLTYVRHGVNVARKGWLTPEQVLNTRPLAEVLRWLRR
jgi:DNA polymerase (family 10)